VIQTVAETGKEADVAIKKAQKSRNI